MTENTKFRMKDFSKKMVKTLIKGLSEGLEDTGDRVVELAKSKVPVDTGNLSKSVDRPYPTRMRGMDTFYVEVGAYTPYAAAVEFGTASRGEADAPNKKTFQPYPIVPKNKKLLHWQTPDGEHHFAKKVMHPGIVAQPYMRPALNRIVQQGEMVKILNAAVEKKMLEAGLKYKKPP